MHLGIRVPESVEMNIMRARISSLHAFLLVGISLLSETLDLQMLEEVPKKAGKDTDMTTLAKFGFLSYWYMGTGVITVETDLVAIYYRKDFM